MVSTKRNSGRTIALHGLLVLTAIGCAALFTTPASAMMKNTPSNGDKPCGNEDCGGGGGGGWGTPFWGLELDTDGTMATNENHKGSGKPDKPKDPQNPWIVTCDADCMAKKNKSGKSNAGGQGLKDFSAMTRPINTSLHSFSGMGRSMALPVRSVPAMVRVGR